MMGGWGGYMGWGLGGLMMLIPLLLVFLVVWAAVRLALPAPDSRSRGSSALEILEQRRARGEISAEQFQEMKKELLGR